MTKKTEAGLVYLLEEIATNAWPARVVQQVDGWRLHHTGGASRRVNSVWPNLDLGKVPLEEKLRLVEAFYEERGLPPRFKMCPAAQPEDLWERLKARGYQATAHTQVQVADIAKVAGQAEGEGVAEVRMAEALPEEWFQLYAEVEEFDRASAAIRRGILTRIGLPTGFAQLGMKGRTAAIGMGVAERGWVGVFCMVTHPDFRRRGAATKVLRGLAGWGQERGAERMYLQVMENNPEALALYGKLGFEKRYVYYYGERR